MQGAGLLADTTNPLVVDVLTGSSSAYSHNPEEPVRKATYKFLT